MSDERRTLKLSDSSKYISNSENISNIKNRSNSDGTVKYVNILGRDRCVTRFFLFKVV